MSRQRSAREIKEDVSELPELPSDIGGATFVFFATYCDMLQICISVSFRISGQPSSKKALIGFLVGGVIVAGIVVAVATALAVHFTTQGESTL